MNELETDYKILKILAHNFEKQKSFSILKILGDFFSEYFNVLDHISYHLISDNDIHASKWWWVPLLR